MMQINLEDETEIYPLIRFGPSCLRNPELLAVIQGADDLLAAGMPDAARALLAPFTGGGA